MRCECKYPYSNGVVVYAEKNIQDIVCSLCQAKQPVTVLGGKRMAELSNALTKGRCDHGHATKNIVSESGFWTWMFVIDQVQIQLIQVPSTQWICPDTW